MMPADAWVVEDPTLCPVCGRDSCEDHLPPKPPDPKDPHVTRLELAVEAERVRREARRLVDVEERPPVTMPVFETLRDRLARCSPPPAWRIEGWQPCHSRVMVAAQFKAGKTTLRDNYIRSKVDGDPFLGRDPVTPITGSLCVIDVEMSAGQMEAWLKAQRIRNDDRVIPIALRGQATTFNLLDPIVRGMWATRLRAVATEDLVLDCLRPMLDALGLDEQREAGQFLVAFDALLIEAGISEALIVHHMGHATERARGDSRLRDWPDVEWRLVRRDEDPASPRYITAYGRDVEVPESRLVYDGFTRRLTIEDGSRRDEKTREALAAVGEVLHAGEQLSGRAIKEALEDSEHPRDAIDAALRLGVRQGVITKQNGPRNAKLYRASVRVSGSVRERFPDTES
jgi:hypothetical protein